MAADTLITTGSRARVMSTRAQVRISAKSSVWDTLKTPQMRATAGVAIPVSAPPTMSTQGHAGQEHPPQARRQAQE